MGSPVENVSIQIHVYQQKKCYLYILIRRSAVVKRVEDISTIVLVNIWVAQVRVPLVLSVGIWISKNSNINA